MIDNDNDDNNDDDENDDVWDAKMSWSFYFPS